MASSRDSSNTPDWRDVHAAIQEMESEGGTSLMITISRALTQSRDGLELMAQAINIDPHRPGPLILASVRRTFPGNGRGALEAELLSLLYSLDWELESSKEWAEAQNGA